MMKSYELTYIVADKSEQEISKVSARVKKILKDGKILRETFWGRRKLAYPIMNNEFGYYCGLVFEISPEKIKEIERRLLLEEEVIRHLIVKFKESTKPKEDEEAKRIKEPVAQVKTKKESSKKEVIKESSGKKKKTLEEKLEEILKE